MSCALPILRERWRAELPTLSAELRFISRRAVQHRELRAAHDDGRTGRRSDAGRFRPHLRRSPSLPEPSRSSARTVNSRMPPVAADELESERQKHSRLQIRRLRARRLQPAPINQSPDRGVRETSHRIYRDWIELKIHPIVLILSSLAMGAETFGVTMCLR